MTVFDLDNYEKNNQTPRVTYDYPLGKWGKYYWYIDGGWCGWGLYHLHIECLPNPTQWAEFYFAEEVETVYFKFEN